MVTQDTLAVAGPSYRQPRLECAELERDPLTKTTNTAFVELGRRLGSDPARPQSGSEWPALTHLSDDPTALHLLSQEINNDLAFERFLREARRRLLEAYVQDRPRLAALRPLCLALAHQSFNNEYLWSAEPREEELLHAVDCALAERVAPGESDYESALLVFGLYRPPAELGVAAALSAVPSALWSPDVRSYIARTLLEPKTELELGRAVPSFSDVVDDTSVAVREMYERHPYPRWLQVAAGGTSVAQQIHRLQPNAPGPDTEAGTAQEILVAGCGTGYHPIRVALDNPAATVVAVDFSRAALGYGVRMARQLGVANLEFHHGDLLSIAGLRRTFDHIECGGVLHHVRERARAWTSVCGVLRPGGTLKIAVYSKVGRLHLQHLRASQRLPQPADANAVRQFRSGLLADPAFASSVKQLARSSDFFATSMLCDLISHPYEHHYTVSELEGVAGEHGLAMLGVNLPRPLKALVEGREPDAHWPVTTFERWKQIEWAYTGTAVMFRFWLRHAGAAWGK